MVCDTRIQAVGTLVVLLHLVSGCGGHATLIRGRVIQHSGQSLGVGTIVLARHERHIALIAETDRKVLGTEVATPGPDGTFVLSRPSTWRGDSVTYLVISRPGFRLLETSLGKDSDTPGTFELTATTSFRDELVAVRDFEREIQWDMSALDSGEERLARDHLAARKRYLHDTYPEQTAASEKLLARRSFRAGLHFDRDIRALLALPDGGLASMFSTKTGRVVRVTDGTGKTVATVSVTDHYPNIDRTALTRVRDHEIAVVSNGVVRRFDGHGQLLGEVSLTPAPRDEVRSLVFVPKGMLLGTRTGELLLYSATGHQLKQRRVWLMQDLRRVFPAPDGSILLFGGIASSPAADLALAGMRKQSPGTLALIRIADWSASPDVLVAGFDDVVAFRDGLLAYAGDLYRAEDHELVSSGLSRYLHQLLFELSWNGRIVATHDVSDGRVDQLTLGHPLGDRLVFCFGDDVFELDLGTLTPTAGPPPAGPE